MLSARTTRPGPTPVPPPPTFSLGAVTSAARQAVRLHDIPEVAPLQCREHAVADLGEDIGQQLPPPEPTATAGALLVTLAVGLVALSIGGSHLVALTAFAGGLAGLVRGSTLITRSRHSLRELPAMPIARALPPENREQ